jgi:hypothetical protein
MLKMIKSSGVEIEEYAYLSGHGYGNIKRNINNYNKAAKHIPFFVLTDLDQNECAPSLINEWIDGTQSSKLLFRIAVREVESWLLADRSGISKLFDIDKALVPLSPDGLSDPKAKLISLAKKSNNRKLRLEIMPADQFTSIGPGYNVVLCNFVNTSWNLQEARSNSPSLDKAMKALDKWSKMLNGKK